MKIKEDSMKKGTINNVADLKMQVYRLELEKEQREEALKEELHDLAENLKPKVLLKKAVVNSGAMVATFSKQGLVRSLVQGGVALLLKRWTKRK
jgi:hypothetical protein